MTREGSIRAGDRTLTYLEAGDPDGPLVLHNHGGPSSRLEAELFDTAAKARGLRFVCADRPGIGGSDLQPGRTFESWTEDLLLLADSFGAQRFAVTGWSEGGPWALAAAAYLDPARLVNVVCIAGGNYGTFGPNWAAKYLSSVDALGGRLALHFHPGFTLMYELLGMSATHFADRYAKAITESACTADREVLADEKVLEAFLAAGRECFRHGADGLVADATMLYEAWPFDMTRVERPVHFWQGSADTLVPEVINKTVADRTRARSGTRSVAVVISSPSVTRTTFSRSPRTISRRQHPEHRHESSAFPEYSKRCTVWVMETVIHHEALARFGYALSDTTRTQILLSLRPGPGYPSELADRIGVSRQILSNHLACLRGCGLVVATPEGRRTRYELADPRIGRALDDLLGLVLAVDPSCCPDAAAEGCC